MAAPRRELRNTDKEPTHSRSAYLTSCICLASSGRIGLARRAAGTESQRSASFRSPWCLPCYRRHATAVRLRLLCTYRGTGTEWPPASDGARAARDLVPKVLPCTCVQLAAGPVTVLNGEGLRAMPVLTAFIVPRQRDRASARVVSSISANPDGCRGNELPRREGARHAPAQQRALHLFQRRQNNAAEPRAACFAKT